jgi:UDP-N-acetyl-D-mannosaminuronic acid dehydrogenase
VTSPMPAMLERVHARTAKIGVVGLGYVGLPAAALIAEAGFSVTGVDRKADRVEVINAGRSPIEADEPGLAELLARVLVEGRLRATTSYPELSEADLVLVSVETPVEADHRPRFTALESACRALGPVLKPGAIVVVESTVAPGTIEGIVEPALAEASGGTAGRDFHVGHCPERVMPGRLLRNMRTMSRVVGTGDPAVADIMRAFYATFVGGELDLADVLTAELVKTAENAFRDVNIAFANELAQICERSGGDVWKVRELVNKSPGRNVLLPGSGVGGHCIPKDPWLLASALGDDAPASLLASARRVNDSMPGHVAGSVLQALAEHGVDPHSARVAVLGSAYLEDSDDDRNSPTRSLLEGLRRAGLATSVHDPFVAGAERDLDKVVAGADCVVLMVAHSAYRSLDLQHLKASMRGALMIDTRHVVDSQAAAAAGFDFRATGIGRRTGERSRS